jgi:trans-aconitate 2-methyltransferase
MVWNPATYLAFADERTRPAAELLARIPDEAPSRVVDLGCGPGNSTEVLAAAFPDATIIGLDNSSDMIAAARKRLPNIRFELADLTAWADPGPFDVILSNAVMQWVPGHETLFPKLLAKLSAGGNLAIQMPDNADEPALRLMREVAAAGPWATKLANVLRPARQDALWYYELMKPLCGHVDLWRTIYFHVIPGGAAGVVEWFKGSALRPLLDALDETERKAFLARYQAAVAAAYRTTPDGTVLLPFPRLFIVARR